MGEVQFSSVDDTWFGVEGSRCGDWGLGFGVWGSGCRVWGLGFRVWVLGCRVKGFTTNIGVVTLPNLQSGVAPSTA